MLTFEYRNLLHSELIPTAIPESRIRDYARACKLANEEIQADRQAGILGFYDLPERDVSHILNFMESLDPKFDTMVVLGIGGSALGNKALYSALKNKDIAWAGLDVHEQEPVAKDYPLFGLDNVILSDHVGWYSEESQVDLQTKAALAVADALSGKTPTFVVNKAFLK